MSEETNEAVVASTTEVRPEVALGGIRVYGSLEAREKLWTAVARARAAYEPIIKSITGRKGNQTFKYAPLAEIFKGVNGALAAEGLGFQQHVTSVSPTRSSIVTILGGHGAEIWSELQFAHPEISLSYDSAFSVKDYGALETYHRRYAASAVFGVEGDRDLDDDPGEAPKPPPQGRRETPQSAPAPQRQPVRREPARTPEKPKEKPAAPAAEVSPVSSKEHFELYADGVTPEFLDLVALALDAHGKLSTADDVAGLETVQKAGKSEKAVGVALSTLVANDRIIRVQKGSIPCYLSKREYFENDATEQPAEPVQEAAPEPEPTAETMTPTQAERIGELYSSHPDFRDLDGAQLKTAVKLDCKKRTGVLPRDLNRSLAATLISSLEGSTT
ncbi:MAG: ERF family protein [Parcubacteria group bacterium]